MIHDFIMFGSMDRKRWHGRLSARNNDQWMANDVPKVMGGSSPLGDKALRADDFDAPSPRQLSVASLSSKDFSNYIVFKSCRGERLLQLSLISNDDLKADVPER